VQFERQQLPSAVTIDPDYSPILRSEMQRGSKSRTELLSQRQLHRPGKRFLVVVVPNVLAGSADGRLFPKEAILEKSAGQYKSAATSVFEIDVRAGPRKRLGRALANHLVPTKLAYRPAIVKYQWFHFQCSVASARAALKVSPTIFFPLTFLIRTLTPAGSKCTNSIGQATGAGELGVAF
jgi:hypothetical protein